MTICLCHGGICKLSLRCSCPPPPHAHTRTRTIRLSILTSQCDGARNQISTFSLFELNSMFTGSLFGYSPSKKGTAYSFESAEEPSTHDFFSVSPVDSTPFGQSRVQKWTESALLNPPPETQNESSWARQTARAQYASAQAENERLKQQVQEAQKVRAAEGARRRALDKQLSFNQKSVHALAQINRQLSDSCQALKAQHNEEVARFKIDTGKVPLPGLSLPRPPPPPPAMSTECLVQRTLLLRP